MRNPEEIDQAQVEFEGKARQRHIRLPPIGYPKEFASRRVSRVVGYENETEAQMGFIPADKLKTIHPSDLSHKPISKASQIDQAFQRPSITTARKNRTTSSGVDMDTIWQQRRGDPNYRPPKQGGFFFSSTPAELIKEREKKLRETRQQLGYQAHP